MIYGLEYSMCIFFLLSQVQNETWLAKKWLPLRANRNQASFPDFGSGISRLENPTRDSNFSTRDSNFLTRDS